MTTYDDVWFPDPDAWGLDRLAWEDEEDGPPIDPDEPSETLEGRRTETPARAVRIGREWLGPPRGSRAGLELGDRQQVGAEPLEIQVGAKGVKLTQGRQHDQRHM
jgi:hypothetical protein